MKARIAVGTAVTALAAVFVAGCGTSHSTKSAVAPSVAPVPSSAVASVPASSAPASSAPASAPVSDSPMDSVLPSAPDVPSSVATAAELANLPIAKPMSKSIPVRVQVPSIGVDSTLMDLGLLADGSLQVPPAAFPAGWYTGAPTPGQLGPAIIVGHIDWAGVDGVFYRLHSLLPGAEIDVTRADGSTAVFRVLSVHEYAKDAFPTKLVYGNTAYSALRLITCGGAFNTKAHSYEDDIVAYAELVGPAVT
ncbi:MAG TPA: class F sortase [Acidothermaceae bacterium]